MSPKRFDRSTSKNNKKKNASEPYVLEVNGGSGDLDLLQGELLRSLQDVSVERDARAPVEVHPGSVAAPQIAEHVASPGLQSRRLNQVYGHVGLAKLEVRTASFNFIYIFNSFFSLHF